MKENTVKNLENLNSNIDDTNESANKGYYT